MIPTELLELMQALSQSLRLARSLILTSLLFSWICWQCLVILLELSGQTLSHYYLSGHPRLWLTKFELGWRYSYYTDPCESSQMNLSPVTVQREGQALSVPYNLGFTFDFWASQRHWFSLIRLAKLPDVRQYSWTSLEISIDSQWSQAHTWFVWIFWWYRFKGTCPSFILGPNQQLWLVSNGWSLGDTVSMIYR